MVALQLSAQRTITNDIPRKPIKPRKVAKALADKSPPGTVWLKDNLYMDDTEVRNIDWLEFYYYMCRINRDSAQNILPDTNCWEHIGFGIMIYPYYYLKHPDFQQFPVVGVSPKLAIAYCQWRTDRVNEYMAIAKGEASINPIAPTDMSKIKKRVLYRLPTSEEWNYAAAGGVDTVTYPLGQKDYYLAKKDIFAAKFINPASNTLQPYTIHDKAATIDLTAAVNKGRPNAYGCYNMVGNVQELIADSVVKGFSYRDIVPSLMGKFVLIGKTDEKTYWGIDGYNLGQSTPFYQPEPWIGFRCIAEVLE